MRGLYHIRRFLRLIKCRLACQHHCNVDLLNVRDTLILSVLTADGRLRRMTSYTASLLELLIVVIFTLHAIQ